MSNPSYGKVAAMTGSGSVTVGETGRIVASDGNVEAVAFAGSEGGECTGWPPTSGGRCVSDTRDDVARLRASGS